MPIRDYEQLMKNMKYSKDIEDLVVNIINNSFKKNIKRYKTVSAQTGVPPFIVFVVHYLECNNNFSCHLHNGDPLTDRTIHVPKGRPKEGNPPFTWEQSAIDALNGTYPRKPEVWSINNTLEYLERYNGLGYYKLGVQSPYIFGNTNLHISGKFQSDGVYNKDLKTKQIGAAIFLKLYPDFNKQ